MDTADVVNLIKGDGPAETEERAYKANDSVVGNCIDM